MEERLAPAPAANEQTADRVSGLPIRVSSSGMARSSSSSDLSSLTNDLTKDIHLLTVQVNANTNDPSYVENRNKPSYADQSQGQNCKKNTKIKLKYPQRILNHAPEVPQKVWLK